MFSNINEAWNNDPVREMTSKLARGEFKTQTELANVFKFKDHNNNLNDVQLKNNSHDNNIFRKNNNSNNNSIDLSSLSSPNNAADLTDSDLFSDFSPYAKVNFNSDHKKKRNNSHKRHDYSSIDSLNMVSDTDTATDSKCSYSARHLKKCKKCYVKLNKLVEKEFKKRVDDIIMNVKMNQLNQPHTLIPQMPYPVSPQLSDSWKETLVITIGAIFAIFIIFLMIKCITKYID